MVTVQKISIAKASQILRIKISTAKLIIKRYKETGTFFQPKRELNQETIISDHITVTSSTPQNQK